MALDDSTAVTAGDNSLAVAENDSTIVVVGDNDTLFCPDPEGCTASGDLAAEAAFYAPEACAELVAVPETGHDLNLHFSAPATYGLILEWMDRRVGSDPRVPAPQPCAP